MNESLQDEERKKTSVFLSKQLQLSFIEIKNLP